MGYKFVKLIPGPTATADGKLVLKELVTRLTRPQVYQIDLGSPDFPTGKHTITVRAVANGVWSDPSNSVKYFK